MTETYTDRLERERLESWLRVQDRNRLEFYLEYSFGREPSYGAAIRRELARREREGITT